MADVVGVTLRITDVPTPSLFCHTSSPFQQIALGFCVVCGFVACLLRFLYNIYMSLYRVGSTIVYWDRSTEPVGATLRSGIPRPRRWRRLSEFSACIISL